MKEILKESKKSDVKNKKSKPLCKWGKDEMKDRLEELKRIVAAPSYVCRKCGRAAKEKPHLCKPEPL